MANETRPGSTIGSSNHRPVEPALLADPLALQQRLASGALDAEQLALACLAQTEQHEKSVQAWQWLDAEFMLEQARACDTRRQSGHSIGPLHGLPVALKDIIDTARIPTENGTPLDHGRVPEHDAFVVRQLRAAGAVIMGKTVTTELAFMNPGKTRNPINPEHTPGGSSSGSAAAVAAAMVPLAIGTQTGGSVIRPAAFCGVVGFKPTFGAIPRTGILSQSASLDTVGVFARTVEGVAMLAETLFGYTPQDRATSLTPHPRLLASAYSTPPVTPTFAFVRTPYWDQADNQTHAALQELCAMLGDQVFELELPGVFSTAAQTREQINDAEMARNFLGYEKRDAEQLSAQVRQAMERGKQMSARDYIAALDWPVVLNAALDEIFTRCDAIIAPAAPGPAPATLDSTGSSIFNGLWTLCGVPAITLPLFEADSGLPMGVQLIGRRGDDARLLRTARWLMAQVIAPAQTQ